MDADPKRSGWSLVAAFLTRPCPRVAGVVAPTGSLALLIPCYFLIGFMPIPGRALHEPFLAWDGLFPLVPAWALVYCTHFVFFALPFLVVRHEGLIRRAVRAYLMVWITSYVVFFLYPTLGPRPERLAGDGFATWVLQLLYTCDPPLNCFPSLHVAHSMTTALVCARLHRGLGVALGVWTALIALSTLYTKQHYVVDVAGGVALSGLACFIFLRGPLGGPVPELDRRAAPRIALGLLGIYAIAVACFWVAYQLRAAG